ncbi:MAG: PHP domain-containing protein [Thermoplasmata archaeon]|nr:PHP domain-containing protein [Thermoplasmata archaeon]
MENELIDFHIHSKFSDGIYAVEDIINFAKSHGFKMIGISDHYDTIKTVSIKKNKLLDYITFLNSLKNEFNLKSAVEIDFSPRTDLENLPFDQLNSLDYILFEYVQDPLWDGYPFWKLIDLLEKINVPIGLAHNNIMRNFKDVDMDEFVDVLETHKIFIEINANDIYTILSEYFFNLSEEFFKLIRNREIPISVGSDMHNKLDDMLKVKIGLTFIRNLNLERNLQLFLELFKND